MVNRQTGLNLVESLALQERAKKIIPGMTQLLSKRPDQFAPGMWPGYFDHAKGCEIWDLDGNHYYDFSISGIGAIILGYADQDVDTAVQEAIRQSTFTSLNAPEEVYLAEVLCQLHPWAQMVRYARGGGEAMSIAVRIARAYTKKYKVAFCGYHGWHDWYLAANCQEQESLKDHLLPGLSADGVPSVLAKSALPFRYNQLDDLKEILSTQADQLAAIVMEPIRSDYPKDGFLTEVRRLADHYGIVLIFDEVSAGFRLTAGGSHLTLGVNPDIAVFAKAISNGYPMAAIIGRKEVMSHVQETFISSTYWTDRIGPVAALATIKKFQQQGVAHHLSFIGKMVQEGWQRSALKHQLDMKIYGIYPMSYFSFNDPEADVMSTIFVQQMLIKGFLASKRFYANLAHTEELTQQYLIAVDEVMGIIAQAKKQGSLNKLLIGAVAKGGFRRLN